MAEQMTGFKIPELIGTRISNLIGERHLARILSPLADYVAVEKAINVIHHKNGHTVEVLATLAPIVIYNKNVGFTLLPRI